MYLEHGIGATHFQKVALALLAPLAVGYKYYRRHFCVMLQGNVALSLAHTKVITKFFNVPQKDVKCIQTGIPPLSAWLQVRDYLICGGAVYNIVHRFVIRNNCRLSNR